MNQLTTAPTLNFPIVRNVPVRMDEQGRMNLNDLHKASGESVNKRPSQWSRLQSTQELLAAYVSVDMHTPLESVMTGANENRGIWAIEELALDYAQWISIPFKVECLAVLKGYNHGSIQQPATTGNPFLDALIETQKQATEVKQEVSILGSEVGVIRDELTVIGSKVEDLEPKSIDEDIVPDEFITASEMYDQLRSYSLSKRTIAAVIKAANVEPTFYNITRNGFFQRGVEHFDKETMSELFWQFINEATHLKGDYYTHPWVARFTLTK